MDMLLEQFKVLFDRPEKVKKLREFILQLAVRGKLVEQDEKDEPAAVMLERIREEKDRLVKEGKIKKDKPLPEIRGDEKPYELPKGWEWVRLGDISNVKSSRRIFEKDYVTSGISFFRSGEIVTLSNGKNLTVDFFISEEKYNEIKETVGVPSKGDLLLASIGASIGSTWIVDDRKFYYKDGNVTQIEKSDYVDMRYIQYFIKSPLFYEQVNSSVSGTAYNALTIIKIKNLIIPLPPLTEQILVMEEINKFMALCDKLETELERKEKYGLLSPQSAFSSIGSCSSAVELEETLKFIIVNFKDLTLGDGAVKELKNAILQLAVQGKLVSQEPTDEPASVLLEKIKEEKERLIGEGKIKKEKALDEISENEKSYELPEGWEWIRMREVAENIHYGYTASATNEDTGVKFLRITDIQNNKVNWETVPFCEIEERKLNTCLLRSNDILIARTGGTIGKSFIVKNVDYNSVFASYLIRVIPILGSNPDFLKLFLETPLYWKQLIDKSQGTGQPNVNAVSLSELLMPIPPLSEQKRIVEKVDSLMSICEKLEKRIEKSKRYSEKLLEAVLKEAFKPYN